MIHVGMPYPCSCLIPTARQEHDPVIECAGNHAATRGNWATAAIEGDEAPAADVGNPQPVSGVPEQVQGHSGRYGKNLKGTIQAKV